MLAKRVLILGGTAEARDLASRLMGLGFDVTSSLAGVTDNPILPSGKIRRGGFGGAEGLSGYLRAEKFDWVVDATHPFATQISANAVAACAETQTKLLRIERPTWVAKFDDQWISVPSFLAAERILPKGAHVMLTLGRKEVGLFFTRMDLCGVARMIETPDLSPPKNFLLILERPPFFVSSEKSILVENHIGYLLCKNSGGPRPAKLEAARELGIPVVMVERPKKPRALMVSSVEEAVEALLGRVESNS